MKQILKRTEFFVKGYPFTFLFLSVFMLLSIIQLVPFFDGFRFPLYALLTVVPLICFCLTIYCFVKYLGDKNRFLKGVLLFFINIIFLYANQFVSDTLWYRYCRTQTNSDKYVQFVLNNCCPVKWQQFGEYLYLNTDCICYYKDKENNHHSLITEKLFKNDTNNYLDEICNKYYHESFQYMYVISDINLTKKMKTVIRVIFFNDGYEIGTTRAGFTDPVVTDVKYAGGRVYDYLITQDKL